MIHIVLQKEVPVIIVMTAVLCILAVIVGKKIVKTDPEEKPKGIVMMACWLVEIIDKNVEGNTNSHYVKNLAPYIGTIAIYLLVANLSGLFGIFTPTQNYSVVLAIALITWVTIQVVSIKENGIKSYLHSFIEPFVPFIIPNFFGCIAPLISMSMRLFGNILSGSIIMSLVYSFTKIVSDGILGLFNLNIGWLNFVGPILAPALHAYFDVFAGFIQMFIFFTLTMVFIGNEIPNDD